MTMSSTVADRLYAYIAHGDAEHRAWLKAAIEKFYEAEKHLASTPPMKPDGDSSSLLGRDAPSDEQLKPCRLCGWAAEFGEVTDMDHPDFGGHFIACTNAACQCCVGLRFANKDDPRPLLAEQWNRSPQPSSLADDEDERGFTPSDYEHTARLLISSENIRKAAASNNYNIILAALYRCAGVGVGDEPLGYSIGEAAEVAGEEQVRASARASSPSSPPDAVLELVETLRKRSIIKVERPTYGFMTYHHGWTCALCDTDWEKSEPEHHTPDCLLSRYRGRKA